LNWLEEKEGKTRTMDTKHFIVELQNFKISYYCWWWGKDLSLRPLGYKTNGIIAIFIIYVNMLELLMSFKITNSIPFKLLYAISQSLQPGKTDIPWNCVIATFF